MRITDKQHVGYVCRLASRLRDAILESLYNDPIPIGADRRPDLDEVAPRLVTASNRALRRTMVTKVTLIDGAKYLMKGGGAKFANAMACRDVK